MDKIDSKRRIKKAKSMIDPSTSSGAVALDGIGEDTSERGIVGGSEKVRGSGGRVNRRATSFNTSNSSNPSPALPAPAPQSLTPVNSTSSVSSARYNPPLPAVPWLLSQTPSNSLDLSSAHASDFTVSRVIGRGLMGTVRLVSMTKTAHGAREGKYLVIKSIRKDAVERHPSDMRHIMGEKKILQTLLVHPTTLPAGSSSGGGASNKENSRKVRDESKPSLSSSSFSLVEIGDVHYPYATTAAFIVDSFGSFSDSLNFHLALEFLPGGELFNRLRKHGPCSPAETLFYSLEVFSAIEHIQALGYVYRDLKPENLCLTSQGHIKLIDFTFCRTCGLNERMQTLCGTAAYLSPEQLDGKFTNGYTRVVDWWSYGILIYELLTGNTPFSTRGSQETHYEIFLRILKKKISFPWSFDSKTKEFIQHLCYPYLEKRLCDPASIRISDYFITAVEVMSKQLHGERIADNGKKTKFKPTVVEWEQLWSAVHEKRLLPPWAPTLSEPGDSRYFRKYAEADQEAFIPPNSIGHRNNNGSSSGIAGNIANLLGKPIVS
jgi:serine/threonine protein kinase